MPQEIPLYRPDPAVADHVTRVEARVQAMYDAWRAANPPLPYMDWIPATQTYVTNPAKYAAWQLAQTYGSSAGSGQYTE